MPLVQGDVEFEALERTPSLSGRQDESRGSGDAVAAEVEGRDVDRDGDVDIIRVDGRQGVDFTGDVDRSAAAGTKAQDFEYDQVPFHWLLTLMI